MPAASAAYLNKAVERTGKKLTLFPRRSPLAFAALPHLSPTEAAQLADDLTAAREALARVELHDPWRS
jgi:hypothetical protein